MSRELGKIWLLLDSRQPGGIESHVLQLADGLKLYGKEVQVVFLQDYGDHPLRGALRDRGIASCSLSGSFISLRLALRQHRPAILHTHGYKAGIYGRLAALLCGIPSLSTYHAGEIGRGKMAIYDWLDRQSARLANKVFAVSPQIAKRLPINSELADNFVNTHGLSHSDGQQIAFVGRLSHEKGPDYFLQLARHFPQHHFHFYGDGPMASPLYREAPDNLHFHGMQRDMSVVWPHIGILVMPSRYEGLPMSALEAMARGIPVLASQVGALDQLIENGCNGWLISPGEQQQLQKRLGEWLTMPPTERQQLSLSARAKIEQRFSANIAIPQLLHHYQLAAACHVAN